MIEFKLVPHKGFGPIGLGSSRESVRAVLARNDFEFRHSSDSMDYFCENSIQVEYEEGTATFIGISQHAKLHCTYLGHDVFSIRSVDLFALFASGETGSCVYNDFEYVFPDQILTVWDAQEQYDLQGGEKNAVYAEIGIGDQRYYESILELKK